jgi:hypothetical protein
MIGTGGTDRQTEENFEFLFALDGKFLPTIKKSSTA